MPTRPTARGSRRSLRRRAVRHVDELLRRHPGLAIDNCASGGRRIDIETIGRSTAHLADRLAR